MVDWFCGSLGGSLIPRLHLTTLLCWLWLQTNLYCADSGSKRISTAQTLAPNDVIYSRWQWPYWDALTSLFYILEGSGDTSSIIFLQSMAGVSNPAPGELPSCRLQLQPCCNTPVCNYEVALNTLISCFRCVWLGLELKSSGW